MSNLALCGFYGYKNYGDSLMRSAIIDFFKNINISAAVFSDKESEEALNFKKENIFEKILPSFEYIALGGGGIISPNFWFFKNNFHKQVNDQQRLCLFNVNLTVEAQPILAEIGPKIALAVVRDSYSLEYAKQFIPKDNVMYAPDISLTLESNFVESEPLKQVVVCLNYYIFKNFFSQNHRERLFAEKAMVEIASFLDYLSSQGYQIVLAPCQTDSDVNDNVIHGVLKGFIKSHDVRWEYSSSKLESLINESSLVISSRYHSSLFALKQQTKFIDITHHSKNANFLKELGLQDFSINYWEVELNKLKNTFEKVKKNETLMKVSSEYGVSSRKKWGEVKDRFLNI
jgi:polysaccharide pyruvyl transferase WcaK-like protein